ncbi:MAG: hypothetical protein ABI068_02975 [Ktedonobacterales bacterium]
MMIHTSHTLRPFGADASGPLAAAVYPTAGPSLPRDDTSGMVERSSPGTGPAGSAFADEAHEPGAGEMACPVCGHPMPDLKGGKATICSVCGFKDSCCY